MTRSEYNQVLEMLRTDDSACERFCKETLSISISIGGEQVWPRGNNS